MNVSGNSKPKKRVINKNEQDNQKKETDITKDGI
jgi:hypothetical protein